MAGGVGRTDIINNRTETSRKKISGGVNVAGTGYLQNRQRMPGIKDASVDGHFKGGKQPQYGGAGEYVHNRQ